MRELWKVRHLPLADRRLLLDALVMMLTMRAALFLMPFRLQKRLLKHVVTVAPRAPRYAVRAPEQVGWAVRNAARLVPAATCLVQGLSARLLLARSGFEATLRIGVAKAAGGAVEAHAWVESAGRVVVGEVGVERFTPMPDIAGPLQRCERARGALT
jgi:hypothetical protein